MKSAFDPKNIEKARDGSEKLELYKLSHTIVLSETHILWESSQLFLLANTFLSGFIGTNLFSLVQGHIGILALCIIGILISILWLLSYKRTSEYYKFRIAQARQREPDGWMLFGGDAKNLSEGDSIKIDDKVYSVRVIANSFNISSLTIITLLAGIFIIFYSLVIFWNIYPILCNLWLRFNC